jgi:hypothetical protein
MRFEVLTAVKMTMAVFWIVALCEHVGGCQRHYVPLKRWYPPASPHGVTIKKTTIDIQ